MKTYITFNRTIESATAFMTDRAVTQHFEMYEHVLAKYLKNVNFVRAYVTETQPNEYGIDSVVHMEFVNSLGMKCLERVSIGGCVSNAPMRIMMINDNEIVEFELTVPKTDSGREWVRQHNVLVM
jgi:hypothetical protein